MKLKVVALKSRAAAEKRADDWWRPFFAGHLKVLVVQDESDGKYRVRIENLKTGRFGWLSSGRA